MFVIAGIWMALVATGCLNPNAYQEFDRSYGYSGEFAEEWSQANQGYVTFVAGEDINRNLLRWHCYRRIAELCEDREFDYFRILKTNAYDTTTKEFETRFWGTSTDAYGNKYNRFKTHQNTVPAVKQHMVFQAFRGPIPTNQTDYPYYPVAGVLQEYHRTKDSRNLDMTSPAVSCAMCKQTIDRISFPEHCPACGQFLLDNVHCPHCFEKAGPWTPGLQECDECSKLMRHAYCPHCGAGQTLRDCSPFVCTFCITLSESGVESGEAEFKCPHCSVLMGWPEELYGEYECAWCTEIFCVHQCERCGTPHALQGPMPFTCWGCSHWIAMGE